MHYNMASSCDVVITLSITTQDGDSALMMAVREGRKDVVSVLVNAGTALDQRNKVNTAHSVLTCPIFTLPPQRGDSAVIMAITRYNPLVLKELIRAGADLNLQNEVTSAILHHLCPCNPHSSPLSGWALSSNDLLKIWQNISHRNAPVRWWHLS